MMKVKERTDMFLNNNGIGDKMTKNNISRRDFFKISGASIIGGLVSTGFGSTAFSEPSAKDFGTVKFGVISDSHLDIKGTNGMKMSAESVNSLRKTVAGLNLEGDLSFVLVSGDLVLDGEKENVMKVKSLLDKLRCPYFVIAGNHDFIPANPANRREGFSYMTIDEFVKTFRGHGYDRSGKRFYSVEPRKGIRLIGLDACMPEDPKKWGAYLPEEQMSFLDSELKKHKNDLSIIMVHHNLIPWSADEQAGGPKEWFTIDNAKDVRGLLAKHSSTAKIVISGHRHIGLNFKELSGVNYFTMPSINSHPMRYTVFQINNRSVTWKTPMVSLPVETHLAAKENLLNATWWRATQYSERNSFSDYEVLKLYENSGMTLGSKKL